MDGCPQALQGTAGCKTELTGRRGTSLAPLRPPEAEEFLHPLATAVRDAKSSAGRLRALGRPSITAVIPALNEAQNLPYILPKLDGLVDEVIIVDGLSEDDTMEVARRILSDV